MEKMTMMGVVLRRRGHHPLFLLREKRMTVTAMFCQRVFENMQQEFMTLHWQRRRPLAKRSSTQGRKKNKKRYDTIQLEIGLLRAEKRQLLIQKCTLTLDKNDDLKNALAESIAEVEEEISTYTKQLSEVDMQTPQKSNRSPPDC
jgi:hypothetical protein